MQQSVSQSNTTMSQSNTTMSQSNTTMSQSNTTKNLTKKYNKQCHKEIKQKISQSNTANSISQTPTGAILPSSTYADGDFHLHLPTPQQGGTYLCRVPQQFLTSACLHDNQTAGQASTQLDRGEVRLMLTEARLRGLEEDKLQLQQQLQSVQRQVTTFKDSLTGQTLALNASLSRRIEGWCALYLVGWLAGWLVG